MGKIRGVVVLITIALIAIFTWDAFNSLNAATELNCEGTPFYNPFTKEVEESPNTECSLQERMRAAKGLKVTRTITKEESDFIIKKAVFLNGTMLLAGAFTFYALGKLQPKRKSISKNEKN